MVPLDKKMTPLDKKRKTWSSLFPRFVRKQPKLSRKYFPVILFMLEAKEVISILCSSPIACKRSTASLQQASPYIGGGPASGQPAASALRPQHQASASPPPSAAELPAFRGCRLLTGQTRTNRMSIERYHGLAGIVDS